MDINPIIPDQKVGPAPRSSETPGCISNILLLALLSWIFTVTFAYLAVTWQMEQTLFQSSLPAPDFRWLVTLGYAGSVLLPAGLVWLFGQALPGRRFFHALTLAGLFIVCMVPSRLAGITSELATTALQIAGGLLFVLLAWLDLRRARLVAGFHGVGLALLIAGVLSYPWVLWGALGSAWDVALSLAAALLFGLSAAQVVQRALIRDVDRPDAAMDLLIDGLAATLALLVMSVGLGVNGNQGLLALAVPFLGWCLAALSHRTRRADGRLVSNGPALALLAGLAAFWPVAFVDPDELAAVISLGVGELIQWANLAALVGMGIGILCALALLVTRLTVKRFARLPVPGLAALVGLVWLGAIGLYVGLGQPGLFGERLFVILKEQADLTSVSQMPDYQQRRAAAYQTLVRQADTTQAAIRSQLERYRIPYQPYYLENALEVQGGPLVLWWLESRPEVDRVLNNPMLRPLPAPIPQSTGSGSAPVTTPWNLKMIGADRVWSELKVSGKGIIVGQSDSGVQGDHPELAGSYRGRKGGNDYNWFDPWNHSAAPTDIGGHGTHTLGTMIGDRVGVAPGAEWIGCVNLARNLGNPAFYLDCMQFMLAPFPQSGDPLRDGKPELGAMVLNNSWGCPPVEGCDPNSLLPAVNALRAAGIFVVASAGNDGDAGCNTVADPLALYAQVYSVGALDSSGNLTSFSSLGPVTVDGSKRVKPDIAAPGDGVLSSFPGNSYASLSGTSMAGPHVVGVVALMWSANPDLIGDIERTQQILDETAAAYNGPLPSCVEAGHPNNGVGYGILDAYAAVKRALNP